MTDIKKVMIVGGGGREHAFVYAVLQSPYIEQVHVAPGNAGTAMEPRVYNIPINATDIQALVEHAKQESIDLTIVGPEQPLVDGIVDAFQNEGLRIFGPSKAAAQLEGSKIFMKEFLTKYYIPTSDWLKFNSFEMAEIHLNSLNEDDFPVVIKTDGLAAGKGVIIAHNLLEAIVAAEDILNYNKFGDAGNAIIIEKFAEGIEMSVIALVDGKNILPLASAQDYKPIVEGGPNTGGMGAISPSPLSSVKLSNDIMRQVLRPTVEGMEEEGHPYVGFLYAGLMIDNNGKITVLEFNVRSGDPETQPIMMRLRSDFVHMVDSALEGTLKHERISWSTQHAVNVVMSAKGYPSEYRTGDLVTILDDVRDNVKIFHAGTKFDGDHIVTAGGRVLSVCALGDTIGEARKSAYAHVVNIKWEGKYWRTDIGY